jgi:hypothetical protein
MTAIHELQARRRPRDYLPLPFFAVFYHSVLFFLATYWPLGKIRSYEFVMVSY